MFHCNSLFNRHITFSFFRCLTHEYHWHEVCIRTGKIVFGCIQPLCLLFPAGAKPNGLFQHGKGKGHGNCHPDNHRRHANQLYTQEMKASPVRQAAVRCKHPGQQGTCRAAHPMDPDGANRVVNPAHLINELYAGYNHKSSNQTDKERAGRRYQVTAGCDGYQSCQ